MPVEEAKDNTQVKPNHVYVIPYNKDMIIKAEFSSLPLREVKSNKLHMPIDQFFHSLAQSQKEKAIGVILSGTASDGTLGLKAIKSEGGITFAQDETAKYQGMPKAAIASGSVDFVLSPEKLLRN
jgi:two-component system, chemotaxis family, CheB/CheR fusion protein